MRVAIFLLLLSLLVHIHADTLEVGGDFTSIGHFYDTSFARYNGWYWDVDYHIQVDGNLTCMCDLDEQGLFLGGNFVSDVYGNPQNIMRIISQFSIALGIYSPDVDGPIYELICKDGSMTIVGNFITAAGGQVVNNVVKWNARHFSWSYYGSGTNGPIYAATAFGSFTEAGGVPVTSLAEWDGKKWNNIGLCIVGVVHDILYYQGSLFIAGRFTVCNSDITNFVIYNNTNVHPLSGVNGTIRSFFFSKTKIFSSGNFGKEGLDEVRYWHAQNGWTTIDDIYFVGQVYAVAYYNSERTFAVGGNFTQIIDNGILKNVTYLVIYDELGWHTIGDLNGPVRFINSSVTSYVEFVVLAIVASIILVLCAGIIIIKAQCFKIKTKKRAAQHTEPEEEGDYGSSLLDLPPGLKALRPVFFGLMGFIALCIILNIALMIIARKRLTMNLQSLMLVSHLWSAELHVSLLVGFMLSVPLLSCPILITLLIKSHSTLSPSYKLSPQFRGIRGQLLFLAGFIFCLVVFLFYFLFTPPPRILAENSLVISMVLVICQLIADGFNLSAIDEKYHGATATLLAVSPAISTALSVFAPAATFLVTYILLWGNYRYSRIYAYEMLENIPDLKTAILNSAKKRGWLLARCSCLNKQVKKTNEHEKNPILSDEEHVDEEMSEREREREKRINRIDHYKDEAGFSFWFHAVFFRLKPTELLNTEHRSVLLIADFFFLQGYSTITPILLLFFTIIDLLSMRRHSTHLGGHFPATTLMTLVTCLLVSPLSPGLFVSLSAPVTLPTIFAITLLCWTYITFFIGGHKPKKWIAVNEVGNGVLGLAFLVAAWEYAENWSAKVPLFVLSTYAVISFLFGFVYFMFRIVSRVRSSFCGKRVNYKGWKGGSWW